MGIHILRIGETPGSENRGPCGGAARAGRGPAHPTLVRLRTMDWNLATVVAAVLLLSGTLLIGEAVRRAVPGLRRIFLPASVIAGAIALLLGPEVLGRLSPLLPEYGVFPEAVHTVWAGLPGLLISVVFAALFLGRPLPGLREIWERAGPQVVVGQTLAWGQYVVGLTLTLLVLTPLLGLSPLAGALIEIGFEGGHGTAAGMADSFRDLGFPEGADLALGLATVGLVSGILLGTVFINRAARLGWVDPGALSRPAMLRGAESESEAPVREGGAAERLALQIGWIAVAVGLGWVLQRGLVLLENATWGADGGMEILAHVPLFPLAMLGGVIVQATLDRAGASHWVDADNVSRISGTALDFTIVAALATLSLTAIGAEWIAFTLLAAAGIAWSVTVFLFIAPRVIPTHWIERGLGDFGQSMGVTVTGLLLMRMVDPPNRSGALESFGYKQLLFEPIVGGGLFTAASLPLIAQFGPVAMLVFTATVTLAWIALGRWCFGGQIPSDRLTLWAAGVRSSGR